MEEKYQKSVWMFKFDLFERDESTRSTLQNPENLQQNRNRNGTILV